jgi:demethoxyubiquinone hydroxylase (CLK1/Coq7/Cat5 family)
MINKQGYLNYFEELYDVEIVMKEKVEKLLEIIEDPKSREILERIRSDEIRHAEIVTSMIKLID